MALYNAMIPPENESPSAVTSVTTIKIRVLHKLPTPYNDELFRTLANQPDIELRVHHLWRGSWRRPWKTKLGTGYPNSYMRLLLGIDWHFLWLAIKERKTFFMVADWGHVAALTLIVARIVTRAPVAIWVDTPQEHLPRPKVKGWLRAHFLKALLKRLDVVFATGEPALREVRRMGARQESLVNLPWVVDLDRPIVARETQSVLADARELRSRVDRPGGCVVFSTTATLVKSKGIENAIRALSSCIADGGDCGLLIAGEGPEGPSLKELVAMLDLQKHVHFLGWIEPTGMDALYLATDVLVHPALWDPFPVAVLEAMAWSIPVVGSNSSGSVEDRVISGVNGYSFQAGNEADLHQKMSFLVKHPGLIPDLGRQARLTSEKWPITRAAQIVINAARNRKP